MRELMLPDLEINFSAYLNAIQLVALVPQTRTPCLFGARVVRDIFQRWKIPRLRGHLVWIPMQTTDDLEAAIAQEALFQDERVFQDWDGERALSRLVSQTRKLTSPVAWDMYLLYSPGAIWRGERIPTPDFWMHQLNERPDLLLDPDRLMAEVQKAIEATLKG